MIQHHEYRGFSLKVLIRENPVILLSTYICSAVRPGKLEQVRDPNGILQVIRQAPDEIEFTITSDDIMRSDAYDNNPAIAILDVFQYKVDEYLKAKEQSVIPKIPGVKTFHCSCCGTNFTTDLLGYTPTCKNCGALMKE